MKCHQVSFATLYDTLGHFAALSCLCSERYAGSGLPQAQGPFLETNLFPLKSGFKMGFCQWAEMGPEVGLGVQKCVKSGSKPSFHAL